MLSGLQKTHGSQLHEESGLEGIVQGAEAFGLYDGLGAQSEGEGVGCCLNLVLFTRRGKALTLQQMAGAAAVALPAAKFMTIS